ncbi:MAG: glycosyltransferase family 4 protein [Parasporobacterium sp.]|nr:glycosyltransferase family 4 protein [Parasporobacterium sp.]MBR3642046.1 glycosyltransferase family 4 protein [Parasporobacterium sp.]
MKILVVCQHYWPENFRINDIVQGFLERGHEVDVLCGQPNYPVGEFFEGYDSHSVKEEMHEGVRIFRTFEVKRGSNSNLRIFLNYSVFPLVSYFRAGKLKNNGYDRIFIYEISPVMMAAAGLRLQKKKKIETVMYVLDLWPQNLYSVLNIQNKLARRFLYWISMVIYKKPDRLITVSEKMRQYFLEKLDFSEEEITFIPQSPEKLYERRISDPELRGRFSKGFQIVFTGNISPAQNFPLILEAAGLLKEEGFSDIHFVIVGDGMSAKDVKQAVSDLKLEEMFTFEGFQPMEQMPAYADIADALIATLKTEGVEDYAIPAKVMSYMALGKPLLIAMEGEINEIVKEARCGLTSDPNDAAQLRDNILTLYRMKKEERENMGENAFLYQQQHFERNQSIDQILQVIQGEKP